MLQCMKLYSKVILVSVSKRRKNKYDMFNMIISGINNLGNCVIFAYAMTNVKCKKSYYWIFDQLFQRLGQDTEPQLMVMPLDEDLINAQKEWFQENQNRTVRNICNQYQFLTSIREMIAVYKKRLDFDYLLFC